MKSIELCQILKKLRWPCGFPAFTRCDISFLGHDRVLKSRMYSLPLLQPRSPRLRCLFEGFEENPSVLSPGVCPQSFPVGTSPHSSLRPCTSVSEIPSYQSWHWGPLTQYDVIWAWWICNVHVAIENGTVSAEGWAVNESGWGTQYIWSFNVLRGTKFHLVALCDSVNCLFIHEGYWPLRALFPVLSGFMSRHCCPHRMG